MNKALIGAVALALAATGAQANNMAKRAHYDTILTGVGWISSALIAVEAEVPGYPNVTPGVLIGSFKLACSHEPVDNPYFKSGRVYMECVANEVMLGMRTRVCVYVKEAFTRRIRPNQVVSDARCLTVDPLLEDD